jgi:hypothetical protein
LKNLKIAKHAPRGSVRVETVVSRPIYNSFLLNISIAINKKITVNIIPEKIEIKITLPVLVIMGTIMVSDAMLCVITIKITPIKTEETSTPINAPAAHSIDMIAQPITNDRRISINNISEKFSNTK